MRMRALTVVLVTATVAVGQSGQSASSYMVDRQEAMRLYDGQNMKAALPLLEKLAEQTPADAVVQERLGMAAWVSSSDVADPAERKAQCLKARAAFQKAKDLGDNSPLLQSVLPSIPENCEHGSFSSKKEVDDLMREAEGAYARADFDTAIRGYERAIELDPNLYAAALYAGDVSFKQKKHDKAAEWFARAIAINPNIETAYRYWGDDLVAQGKMAEAREKFIDALLGWPYDNRPWLGLQAWAKHANVQLRAVQIKPPSSVQFKDNGDANINIDPASLKDDSAGAAWLMYSMTRVSWHNKTFAEKFPGQKYRHTLDEEVEALGNVVTVAAETQKKKAKELDPQLKTIIELKQKGLVEAYVLLSAPDPEIAKDYAAYRDSHRDKLREYLSTYIVPPAP